MICRQNNTNIVGLAVPSYSSSVGNCQPIVVYPHSNRQTVLPNRVPNRPQNSLILNQLSQRLPLFLPNVSSPQQNQNSISSLASAPQQNQNSMLSPASTPLTQRTDIQREKDIQKIANELRESFVENSTKTPTESCRETGGVIELLNDCTHTQSLIQTPTSISVTHSSNAVQNESSFVAPVNTCDVSDRTYELHMTEDCVHNETTTAVEQNRSSNPNERQIQTQESVSSDQSVSPVSVTKESSIECVTTSIDSHPKDSNNERSESSGDVQQNLSQRDVSNERVCPSKELDCSPVGDSPMASPMDSPSNNSLFSELSSNDLPNDSELDENDSQTNERQSNEETIEETTASLNLSTAHSATHSTSHSTTPVAVISPMTPSDETSDDEIPDEDTDCVVCSKEYGEFICCSQCPRAFHIECHVPELKKMPEFVPFVSFVSCK